MKPIENNMIVMSENEDRDRTIRELHKNGKTYREIGEMFSMTGSRVGQIVKTQGKPKAFFIPLGNLLPSFSKYSSKFIAVNVGVGHKTIIRWMMMGVPSNSAYRFLDAKWPEKEPVTKFRNTPARVGRVRQVSIRTRFLVMMRDGFRCKYCGATAAETKLHVDHVVPFSKGGQCAIDNLVTACKDCNLGKNDIMIS
jgi:hypothetical protein